MSSDDLLERMREQDFAQVLHDVNQDQVQGPDRLASEIGTNIFQRVDSKAISDFREPIVQERTVGFLGLLYMTENDITEKELIEQTRDEAASIIS